MDERDGMIMDSMGKRKFFGGGKNNLVEGEDRLEVRMKKRCLNSMNGVELGNSSKRSSMTGIGNLSLIVFLLRA